MNEKTKKQLIATIGVATGGLSGITIAGYMAIYDSMFKRQNRPNYSLTPGLNCFEKIKDQIDFEKITFKSDKEKLQGYYYKVSKPKGLVVIAHGLHSGADDYLPFILNFCKNDFNVFTFDYKGTYDSTGDNTVGMCESLVDLDHAIDFIKSDDRMNKLPLFLFGHSWGGYAVTSVLNIKNNIKAVACVAPMNDGFKMILEKGEQYVGKAVVGSKPFLDIYQKYLFRKYATYNGVDGINKSNIPVLIAQGINDDVITYNGQSITAHIDEITNKNVSYYWGYGLQGGHNTILYSINAIAYREKIKSIIFKKEKDDDTKISEDDLINIYSNIDNYLYSEVNPELFEQIIDLFNKNI